MATFRGGDKFEARLRLIAESVGRGGVLSVGFLENATYPKTGMPVATIAAIQDFGAPGAGIPPRPFFRNLIAAKQAEWPMAIADLLRDNGMNVQKALDLAGFAIAGQLKESIINTNDPGNAASTIRKKGFDKPLVDTGHMLSSVDHEVKGL